MRYRLYSVTTVLLLLVLSAQPADAQIWKKAKEAAKRGAERAVERETARRADRAVTAAFGLAEDAVVCTVTDEACIEQAQAEGNDVVVVDQNGDPLPADQQPSVQARQGASGSAGASATARPGEGAWANYDFVPGERVLYFDDFESEYVGNVPGRIDFKDGVMEVVRDGDNQMLRFSEASAFAIPLPETLPGRFTIEFDLYSADNWNTVVLGTGPLDAENSAYHCFHSDLRYHKAAEFRVGSMFETGVKSEEGGSSSMKISTHEEAMMPVRISVDGSYVKMYVGEQRVANVPNADVQRTDRVLFTACGELAAEDNGSRGPVLVDNVRIAAGGREVLYDKLVAEGRVATHGVLFDTGSATIKPESTPTLQDIARTLQQHSDLRLRIEGHTDNTGSADANMQLSERRAAAVRDYLVQRENIAADRLESAGMGQTVPAADNGTPEGRQTNRRVELVVL